MTKGTFFCVDAHTCGNPVRVVAGGAPALRGGSLAAMRADFLANHDWVRRALMFEPRGHDVMSGSILYPATRDDCDIGCLFIEVSGCLPMCGHGTIGTVTVALEQGLVTPRVPGELTLEVPAGKVRVLYETDGRFVDSVQIHNVPSYLHAENVVIDVPDMGPLTVDVAYGGNYYAIIEPQAHWQGLAATSAGEIVAASPLIRALVEEKVAPVHPEDPAIAGVSHVLWADGPQHPEADARNAVFYGEKAIDRSPCGTGSSARMAQWVARGRLGVGDSFVHESIIGTLFRCRVEGLTTVAGRPAILPSVSGWARVTGLNTIFVDPRDPLVHGFQII